MTPSDPAQIAHNGRQRRLLVVLALGFIVFAAAAAALYYILQPETLRIAVGPAGSDDQQVVEAMAEAFADESRSVRLSPITTEGAAESLALLGAGKAELAVGRGDLSMPSDAQMLAVLRKNYVVLWTPSGRPGKESRKKPKGTIGEIADLAGHKVGIIGRTGANLALLRTVLVGSGVDPDKVTTVQFGTDQIEKLAQDTTLDAYLAVGLLDSRITADAIAATSRSRGAPKFLPVDASEAIALRQPRYEAEEFLEASSTLIRPGRRTNSTPLASAISSSPGGGCRRPKPRPSIASCLRSATRSRDASPAPRTSPSPTRKRKRAVDSDRLAIQGPLVEVFGVPQVDARIDCVQE